jgi:hypothetical protein
MGEPHLDLLALPAGLLEGFRVGQRTDVLTHLFIKITSHFAHNCAGALRLQGAGRPDAGKHASPCLTQKAPYKGLAPSPKRSTSPRLMPTPQSWIA